MFPPRPSRLNPILILLSRSRTWATALALYVMGLAGCAATNVPTSPQALAPSSPSANSPASASTPAASDNSNDAINLPPALRKAVSAIVNMDRLTAFGLFAVTAMLVTYSVEDRSPWAVLAFAAACVMGSTYGFLQGAWPFGIVEGFWSIVALRRWWLLTGSEKIAGRGMKSSGISRSESNELAA